VPIDAACQLHQFGRPVPACEGRIQPLQEGHAHGRAALGALAHALDTLTELGNEVAPAFGHACGVGDLLEGVQHALQRRRLQVQHARARTQLRDRLLHGVERHRAHIAQRLRNQ
jgi:hypothetical protein